MTGYYPIDECDHGSDPATCVVCTPSKARDTVEPDVDPDWLSVALHGSMCQACGEYVEVGDKIVRRKRGHMVADYIHEECK